MVRAERSSGVRRRAKPSESYEEPDLVRQYLTQIASTPLLTAEDEVELGRRVRQGAQAAERLRRTRAWQCPGGGTFRTLRAVTQAGAMDRRLFLTLLGATGRWAEAEFGTQTHRSRHRLPRGVGGSPTPTGAPSAGTRG